MQHSQSTQNLIIAAYSYQQTPTLTSLLPDVLPNIFSRLPISDLLAFSRLNKEARQASNALLLPKAISLFVNFDLDDYQDSLKKLACFFRNDCTRISNENWLALLNEVAAQGIDRQLLEVLLHAFAGDNIALPTIPGLPEPLQRPWITINGCSISDPYFDRRRSAAKNFVCQISAVEMFDVANGPSKPSVNQRALVERRGWAKLAAVFTECEPEAQIQILLRVRPRFHDWPEIHLAFEELVIAHIEKLEEDTQFLFSPDDYSREHHDAYFSILADFCTFRPSVGKPACFVSMFSKRQSNFPDYFPWKDSGSGTCNFVFRLLAAEIRGNKASPYARSSLIESLALRRFITREELDHFTDKLNARMDRGMSLEHAVEKWLDDSRASGKCAIS